MTSYFTPPLEELDYLVLAVYYDFCFCCYYYPVLAGVAVGLALLYYLANLVVEFVLLHCPVDVFAEASDYLADVAVLAVVLQHYPADLTVEAFGYSPVVVVLALVVDVDSDYDFVLADLD